MASRTINREVLKLVIFLQHRGLLLLLGLL